MSNQRSEPAYFWEFAFSRVCGLLAGWTDFLCGERKGQHGGGELQPQQGAVDFWEAAYGYSQVASLSCGRWPQVRGKLLG